VRERRGVERGWDGGMRERGSRERDRVGDEGKGERERERERERKNISRNREGYRKGEREYCVDCEREYGG
jgi:hypothetical protein